MAGQSLPVTSWQVLRAKLRMHLLLRPFRRRCAAYAWPCAAGWRTALAWVVAALFTVLSALLCLFLGLKMPNLHWTSEITPSSRAALWPWPCWAACVRPCWRPASS